MRNYIAMFLTYRQRHTSISYIIIIIIMHYWQLFFICYQQQQLMIGNHNFSAEPNDFGSLSINSMWQVFIQEQRTFIFRKNSLYFTYPQLYKLNLSYMRFIKNLNYFWWTFTLSFKNSETPKVHVSYFPGFLGGRVGMSWPVGNKLASRNLWVNCACSPQSCVFRELQKWQKIMTIFALALVKQRCEIIF